MYSQRQRQSFKYDYQFYVEWIDKIVNGSKEYFHPMLSFVY